MRTCICVCVCVCTRVCVYCLLLLLCSSLFLLLCRKVWNGSWGKYYMVPQLPFPAAGEVDALFSRHLSIHTMKRTEEVLRILVNAYWSNSLSSVQPHVTASSPERVITILWIQSYNEFDSIFFFIHIHLVQIHVIGYNFLKLFSRLA